MANIILYTNLKVLCSLHSSLASDNLKKILSPSMFKIPNKHGFQQVLYFLLKIIDCGKEKLKILWPIVDTKGDSEFFNAAQNFLRDLSSVFTDVPTLSVSFRSNPTGERFILFMCKLSMFALQCSLHDIDCDSSVTSLPLEINLKEDHPMPDAMLFTFKTRTELATQSRIQARSKLENQLTAAKEISQLKEMDVEAMGQKKVWIELRVQEEVRNAEDCDAGVEVTDLVTHLEMMNRRIERRMKILEGGFAFRCTVLDGSTLRISAAVFSDEMKMFSSSIQVLAPSLYFETEIVLTSLLSTVNTCLPLIHMYSSSIQDVISALYDAGLGKLRDSVNKCSLETSELMTKILKLVTKLRDNRGISFETISAELEDECDFMAQRIQLPIDINNIDSDNNCLVVNPKLLKETNLLSYFENNMTFKVYDQVQLETAWQSECVTLTSEMCESGYFTSSRGPSVSSIMSPCTSVTPNSANSTTISCVTPQITQLRERSYSCTPLASFQQSVTPSGHLNNNTSLLIDKSLISPYSLEGDNLFSPLNYKPGTRCSIHSVQSQADSLQANCDLCDFSTSDDSSVLATPPQKSEVLDSRKSSNVGTPFYSEQVNTVSWDNSAYMSDVSLINVNDICDTPESDIDNVSAVKNDEECDVETVSQIDCSDQVCATPVQIQSTISPIPTVVTSEGTKQPTKPSSPSIQDIIARLHAVRMGKLNVP